ncbi:MAG TPA: MscL family protein [Candidatus Saccharimonadales bacterium]
MATRRKHRVNTGEVRVNRTVIQSSRSTRNSGLPSLKVPRPFQGFVNFIREQGVVGIGVGFVIGSSAAVLIKSIVSNLLNPLIGLVMGGTNLANKVVCLNSKAGVCENALNYGQVISDIISFLLILAVVYFVIKGLRLEKLDKEKVDKK